MSKKSNYYWRFNFC